MSDGLCKMFDDWDKYMSLCEEFKIKAYCLFDDFWYKHYQNLIELKEKIKIEQTRIIK